MICSRALPAFLVMAALSACSPDKPGGPSNPIASRLTEAADAYAAQDDYRAASALYSASAMVRAGGRISSVEINVDTAPRTFSAVGLRVTLSRAACEQMKSLFDDLKQEYPPDSSGGFEEFVYDPCKPEQSLIAWEGENMSRIVLVHGDTGTNVSDPEAFQYNFYGELYDRESKTEWWMRSGRFSADMVGGATACRSAAREPGVSYTCRLVTLAQSFDIVLEEWPSYDFVEGDSLSRAQGRKVRADVRDTAIWIDSTYVWEPLATHTLDMPRRTVAGLWMEITKFNFDDMMMHSIQKSRMPALRRSRSR